MIDGFGNDRKVIYRINRYSVFFSFFTGTADNNVMPTAAAIKALNSDNCRWSYSNKLCSKIRKHGFHNKLIINLKLFTIVKCPVVYVWGIIENNKSVKNIQVSLIVVSVHIFAHCSKVARRYDSWMILLYSLFHPTSDERIPQYVPVKPW